MHEYHDTTPAGPADNPYAPTTARIADDRIAASPVGFRVVAPAKAALPMIGTFGFRTPYWFWRPWKRQRIDKRLDIRPVPRAVMR